MAVDLLALNEDLQSPPGLTIDQVGDAETLKRFCYVAFSMFEWPGFAIDALLDYYVSVGLGAQSPRRYYMGWLKGEPVATSNLVLGAGVAGIYGVATIPDARRQGIGTAMTLTALREARALGYRVGVLFTGEKGTPPFRVYHRIGFREYCRLGHYVWTSETEQSGEPTNAT